MYVDMPTSNHRSLAGLQEYYIIMNVLVLCYVMLCGFYHCKSLRGL